MSHLTSDNPPGNPIKPTPSYMVSEKPSQEMSLQTMSIPPLTTSPLRRILPPIVTPPLRLLPTDIEVFENFLIPSINQGADNVGIQFLDIYQFQPNQLPGFKSGEFSYFLSPREAKGKGVNINRTVKGSKGLWRSNNKVTLVKDSKGVVLGRKNKLNYLLRNEDGSTIKTNYLMTEYVVDKGWCKDGDTNHLVFCKIYERKLNESEVLLKQNVQKERVQELNNEKRKYSDDLANSDEISRKSQKLGCSLEDRCELAERLPDLNFPCKDVPDCCQREGVEKEKFKESNKEKGKSPGSLDCDANSDREVSEKSQNLCCSIEDCSEFSVTIPALHHPCVRISDCCNFRVEIVTVQTERERQKEGLKMRLRACEIDLFV